jgi:hypothetical protein
MKYKIINNFLEVNFFKKLQNTINNNTPWFWKDSMTGKDKGFFYHMFFQELSIKSNLYDEYIVPILNKLECKAPINIRANLMIKHEKQYKSDYHVDFSYPCKTAILYLNTCNGYTEFDKKTKVKCEENKILIFDSSLEHCAVSQTDKEKRIVINFNYI